MPPSKGEMTMLSKISIAATVALVAILAAPNASFAAKKHKGESTSTSECLGGGCTGVNPDRVTQPCNGSNCYKRSKTKKTTSATSAK